MRGVVGKQLNCAPINLTHDLYRNRFSTTEKTEQKPNSLKIKLGSALMARLAFAASNIRPDATYQQHDR